ncbi:alpha/beta hydrolase [Kitasatospora sp. NPDC087314]|uniref:alpha/beta hydrolase n=1 Tax=Kitasatospora sp. NPDC087314 TaxID=3364068 RepID=UPI0037F19CDE
MACWCPSCSCRPSVRRSRRCARTPAGPRNVLLLQNRYDPATPYSGARQTLAAFGHRAAMVTVDAAGHGVDFGAPRVSGPFTSFLLTGRLPA